MRSLSRASAPSTPAAKSNRTLTTCCALTAWLSLAATGCAVGEPETAAAGEGDNLESLVDAQVLENVRQLERGIVGAALQHEGRIWYGRRVVTTFLTAQDGSGMAFTLGASRDYAALDLPPPVGATAPLWDVLAQQAVEPTHVFPSESGVDVVLFDAQPQTESGIGQTTEALFGPQACPTTFFPETCNPDNQLQYVGSVLNRSLSNSDQTNNLSSSELNVESSTIAVCSEVGGMKLLVTTSNPAWGTVPGGTGAAGLTVPEGYFGVWANYGTWRERRFCAKKILGVCVEHDYRIQFQDFDIALSLTKLNVVSEYSYCANFYVKSDEVHDNSCNNIFCPVVRPGG